MAQNAPSSIDVTDIQFKVHDKFAVFNAGSQLRSSINLLATASNYGLMFVGNPNEAELKVIQLKDLVDCKASGRGLHARQVQLPNLPNCIACSCDGSMLAVNYTQNGCGFVAIYSVPSFTTANIKSLHNIRLPGDEHISAIQLLWNPVITGSLAVVMSNGALGMYDFKNNSYEFHTLDSKEQIMCGSWSPKGKQIVLGFPNGKLAQYKPDLKLARTIPCPPNIHPGPFNTISIQWLSTFQFAVVFLQQGEEATPSLYIVHAPKAGGPTYTNYYDICYSGTGPRAQQMNLLHIQPWNLLLVTSANGVEVGIIGTKETTEAPTWIQYTLLDEARIEMPLTEDKNETYPIGFALDTSCSHQLTIAEKKLPVMPMIHILSTHGQLVSFNFLNLQPNTPDICSPPAPASDTSGRSQFKPVSEMLNQRKPEITIPATMPLTVVSQSSAPPAELSFAPVGVTMAPALEKPKPIFGTPVSQTTTGSSMFGGSGFGFAPSPVASVVSGAPSLFRNSVPVKTTPAPISFGVSEMKKQPDQVTTSTYIANPDLTKPLYTVSSTFNPPSTAMPPEAGAQQLGKSPSINANEVDDIVNEMIALQIASFDLELKKLGNQSKGLLNNIENTEEMKTCSKRLNDLREIVDQANDREFESDLRSLRNSLNESYTMVAECRSKLNLYNNPDIVRLTSALNYNPINRRQLAKLNCYLATNQAQLQTLQNEIDCQWSNFQDLVRRNSRTQMRTPGLEGVYQRMTKVKDMIARERTRINYIKSKLKQSGLLYNQTQGGISRPEVTMESLTDTILSMSLAPTVEQNRSKLTKEKLNNIREMVRKRPITIIKPQRPDRVGLRSEVILETKLKSDRKIRDGAATNMDKMEQERIKNEQQRVLTKPTATKAVAVNMSSISQPNAPTNFGFGDKSPFVKPNIGKPEEFKKDQQQPGIVKPVASTAAPMFLKATPSITSTTSAFSGFGQGVSSNSGFTGFAITPTTMPAFSGFGTNTSLSFGAPKPLTQSQQAKEPSTVDSTAKEQTAPQSFAPKPMAADAKPFQTSSFSSPFAAVAPSKPAEPVDKENKLPESQPFMPVGGRSEVSTTAPAPAVSTSAPAIGFGALSVSTGTASGFSFGGGITVSTQAKTTTPAAAPFSFSFGSALNSGTDPLAAAPKPSFGDFAKQTPATPKPEAAAAPEVSVSQAKSDSPESNSDSTGFTFNSLNLGTLGLPATPNLSPTPSVSTIDSSSLSSATTVKTASASDPADSIFEGLTICKPTSAENGALKTTFGGGNFFGGSSFLSGAGPDTKSIFGVTPASKETSAFTGFGNLATDAAAETTISTSSSTDPLTSTTATSSAFPPKTTQSFSFGIPSATTTPGSIVTGQAATSTVAPSSVFSTTSSSAPSSIFAAAAAATTTAATAAPPSGGSIFGGTGLNFKTLSSQATPSIFGATTATTAASPFATSTALSAAPPVVSPFGAGNATSATSMFSSASITPAVSTASGNIFGGIPKPDQSVFGQPEANVFGDKSASGGSLFGGQTAGFGSQPSANTGGSIFGGSSAGTGQMASPFGAAANNANSGGNIFGSPTPSSAPSVFGTPTQPTATSGGSIFEQSSGGGQSGGSLFGGATAQPSFGTSASPFGGNAASGGSIFGGSSTTPKPSAFGSPSADQSAFGSGNTGGFGLFSQQSQAFGSPAQAGANAGGGSFAQGGSTITQTGFGSPTAGAAFQKPVFGAAPAFGAPPAFGSPPSFGSAATFSSPKGFGSFPAPDTTGGSFSTPTQKNNLFEELGSSDTGLSFGNLAQNTNANAPKPPFGGSSFMSYRS